MRAYTLCFVLLATHASADKRSGTPVVAADGKTTFRILRTMAEGDSSVDVSLQLPSGWKWNPSTLEPTKVSGEYEFVLNGDPLGGPTLRAAVRMDNRTPEEVPGVAKEAASELKKHVVGGGKVVKLINDARKVELGPKTHGLVTSAEIDASAERHQHYWETTCYAYRDDGQYVLTVIGTAHEKEKKLVSDFEKLCESLRLGGR